MERVKNNGRVAHSSQLLARVGDLGAGSAPDVDLPARAGQFQGGKRIAARKWLISARMAEISHLELCNFFGAAEFK